MDHKPRGIIVVCSYQPKPGKLQALLDRLKDHVPTLRMLGMVTGYPRTLMVSAKETVIEIFEWESEEASRNAHDHPEVRKFWNEIDQLAAFVPLNSLAETQKPFAHFRQIENDRKNRVVHFEIEAEEPAKVSKFYESVFGWEFSQWGNNPYWLADTGREPCPGIDGAVMKRKRPGAGVTNIIHVDSIDESIKKIEGAGGKLCVPKQPIEGVGYVAYCMDPEDNVFGMMQSDMNAK